MRRAELAKPAHVARHDREPGSPGFENNDSKRLVSARQDKDICLGILTEKLWAPRPKRANEHNAVCYTKFDGAALKLGTIVLLSDGAYEPRRHLGMLRQRLDYHHLVFLPVNSGDAKKSCKWVSCEWVSGGIQRVHPHSHTPTLPHSHTFKYRRIYAVWQKHHVRVLRPVAFIFVLAYTDYAVKVLGHTTRPAHHDVDHLSPREPSARRRL